PEAIVAFPATTYWADQNAGRKQFYDRLLDILVADPDGKDYDNFHDAVALNLYRDPDDVPRIHGILKEIQASHSIDKPVWLTEMNAMPTNDQQIACPHSGDPIGT